MRPTGGVGTARDEEKDMMTTDYREYKCDNPQCGFAQSSGKAKVAAANEQAAISEPTNTTTSSPAATTAAVQSAVEAVGAAVEGDKDKGNEGRGKKASYTTTSSPSGGSSNENPA